MKIYRCPECGSPRAWKHFLIRSGPMPCPSCGTGLVALNAAPWTFPAFAVELVFLGAYALVAFREPQSSLLNRLFAGCVLFCGISSFLGSRGYWVKETLGLSEDEVRSKTRMAEEFIRHGMNLREAAEKLSVPPAVLRIWRKRYGD
jgi:hypothetical protein